ncbi:Uncharacterized protein Adt_31676 [Abeliophyllum distichum]|uniref:Uncharacterized protein n=1 Tax=Abeliophyllum distichum TaxID=126358 RepID=A0ABD1REV4_9LAMI
MIDSSSNDSLSTKTVVEALELFERVVTTTAMWASDRVVHKRNVGVHEIDTFTVLSIKIDSLNASIKNLETQMGQMVVALSGIAPGTLPSNTEVNSKEYVRAITTKNGVQLPEIHVKRLVVNKEKVLSTDEEHME